MAKTWDKGSPLGLNIPTEIRQAIDQLPHGARTRFLCAMLSVGLDPAASEAVEELMVWVDKARRGAVDADPDGLARVFALKILAEDIARLEKQIASLKRRLESE